MVALSKNSIICSVLMTVDVLPVRGLGSRQMQDVTERPIFAMFLPIYRNVLSQGPKRKYDYFDKISIRARPTDMEASSMITAGIDCGAKNTKTVILKDGKIIGKASVPTGFDQTQAVRESLGKALDVAGITRDKLNHIGGTGSGAKAITEADVQVNDIKAISVAANFFFPNARTVADVGAEEARAAKLDEKGIPVDFAINDKCAAGAGVFLEAMARALETPLEQLGPLALTSDKAIPMNAQCAIFAESEVVGLIHLRTEKKDISKAIHDAMASRIVSMIRRVGVNPDVVMLGGVAYNPGFVEAFRREVAVDKIYIPDDPEYGAAVGAAVLAAGS